MGLCEEEVLALQGQVDKMKRSNARLERDNATLRARLAEVEGERDDLLAIDTSTGAFVRIRALREAAEARAEKLLGTLEELADGLAHHPACAFGTTLVHRLHKIARSALAECEEGK